MAFVAARFEPAQGRRDLLHSRFVPAEEFVDAHQ